MQKPYLIIITELSGTGKTTRGQQIVHALRLPCMRKDTLNKVVQ